MLQVTQLQTILRAPADKTEMHLGECQSIIAAKKFQGFFVTDDQSAYDQSARSLYLGNERTLHLCNLLALAQSSGDLSQARALEIHRELAKAGRFMLCTRKNVDCDFGLS